MVGPETITAAPRRVALTADPVPRLWPGSTIVCLGSGPSLTTDDVEYCRNKARVIAVNDAYRLAPWADVLYAADRKWWAWKRGVPTFEGLKYTLEPWARQWPGVRLINRIPGEGICTDPRAVKQGGHSGYQVINLAVHFGAARILLLGYDMQVKAGIGSHFFGEHPDGTKPPFQACLPRFASLLTPLALLGIALINCSRETAITAIPRRPLREALL